MKIIPTGSLWISMLWATTALLSMPNSFTLAAETITSEKNWTAPRTIDDQPDLQGVWANNSITPVERPEVFGDRTLLTADEMQFLSRRMAEILSGEGDALFGESVLDAAFSGNVSSRDTQTGNYDQQWMVERTLHNRTSQIIDPLNGHYPAKTPEAIEHENTRRLYRQEHPADSWLDRSLSERCQSRGVPNLRPGYNSYWQIVQSKHYVTITQEMFHDVRIIPLTAMPKLNENIKLWNGSSRGYWDNNTLVIDTQNYSEAADPGLNTTDRVFQERLTRINEHQLQYDFIEHDPGTYTADYTRRLIFDLSADSIYEYACHEGNYGIANILRGHRVEESRTREDD